MPKVSGYAIQREVGKGGMGVVYRARREGDNRIVALKILPHQCITPTTTKRFQREGNALLSIVHPNIVEVYEVSARDGHHFIAMELLEGHPLSMVLSDSVQGVAIEDATRMAYQLAGALEEIHGRGLIHRDLKPGNIFITDDGALKLLDFGLVQVEGLTMLTATGSLLGTPLYMSPEQCSGQLVDARTDIYSFGVVLYHLLAGRPPFMSDNMYDLLEQHKKATPPRICDFRPQVPLWLQHVVMCCLEKNPDDRIGSMAEVRRLIEQDYDPQAAQGVETNRASPQSGSHPRSKRSSLIRIATCFVLIGVTAVVTFSSFDLENVTRALGTRFDDWFGSDDDAHKPELERQLEDQLERAREVKSAYARGIAFEHERSINDAYSEYCRALRAYPHATYVEAIIRVTSGTHLEKAAERVLRSAASEQPELLESTMAREFLGRQR